jgi:1-acyl-sn-glycerol-3-phosphate acyltransferase
MQSVSFVLNQWSIFDTVKFLQWPFYFILALISAIAALISLLIVTPAYALIFLLGGKKAAKPAHRLSRVWAEYVMFFSGTWLTVYNRELLDKNQTYVFVSNHQSHLDIPACAASTGHIFKFLAKEELGRAPLLGYIIRKLYITVDRSSLRARVLSMQKMEKTLNEGISVWIYPEGTRNKSKEPLGPFFDGAFQLAIASQKPVAVLTIIGTRKILPSGEFFQLHPARVKAYWSTPIATVGMGKEDVPRLREQVRTVMLEVLKKNI